MFEMVRSAMVRMQQGVLSIECGWPVRGFVFVRVIPQNNAPSHVEVAREEWIERIRGELCRRFGALSRSTPVAASQTGTAEGAAQHSQENEYDHPRDKEEHQHQDKSGGGSEEVESSLKFGVGIATCLLL